MDGSGSGEPKDRGERAGSLGGRRILITRPRSQAAAFADRIERLGGEVVSFPTIEIVPPASYTGLDAAVAGIDSYDWIFFTSVNGVDFLLERMRNLGVSTGTLKNKRIAAIGPETARRLEREGIRVHILPREYRAEAILHGLKPAEMRGRRVLLPRAAKAREVLPDTLRQWGAEVVVVEAYRALPVTGDPAQLRAGLKGVNIDAITFTSSSTVEGFVALFSTGELETLMAGVGVACIGPITKATAEAAGLRVDVVAREYTTAGLAQALVEHFASKHKA